MQQSERAVIDLRQGDPVHITDGEAAILALAVEAIDTAALRNLVALAGNSAELALTPERAVMLDLNTACAASLRLDHGTNVRTILDLAAAANASWRPAWPAARPVTTAQRAALALGKAGRLLPAMMTARVDPATPEPLAEQLADQRILTVRAEQALALSGAAGVSLRRVSGARIPLLHSEDAHFVLFREGTGMLEHVAILIGAPDTWAAPVPVRLHSACLTGDLFGSLRCDCGEQLRAGVANIAAQGGGVLLYLAQEGRGIGLANKLRAYALQDDGLDTLDADRTLGFTDDERDYEAAVAMLASLEIDRVRLLTNNPRKIEALRAAGIEVVDREALHGRLTAHNHRYLSAKAARAGHLLSELLEPDGIEAPAVRRSQTGI